MTLTIDRRTAKRLRRIEEHGVVAARVRPGHRAHLVDVSAAGALIETSYRLLPGASVELHLETDSTHTRIRGRVLRCAVVRVRPSFVHYRGAIAFDRSLPWFVDDTRRLSDGHDLRTAHPRGALATPEVI
ncbi:MAG TPA: PilZ domain-containing protein [Vicinamibacterales bacterium]|nr:PilZ domain-containing protein [Vicinamibacterales bacterium]